MSNWHARAAAVKALQPWYLAHYFLLTPAERAATWKHVLAQTADPVPEIRSFLAPNFLPYVRSLPLPAFAAFRKDSSEGAKKALRNKLPPMSDRVGRTSAALKVQVAMMKIQACVMAYPESVELWHPDMLVLASKAVSKPEPIKKTAVDTLAAFKQAHENTMSEEERGLFSEEQWHAVSGSSFVGTYFT